MITGFQVLRRMSATSIAWYCAGAAQFPRCSTHSWLLRTTSIAAHDEQPPLEKICAMPSVFAVGNPGEGKKNFNPYQPSL